MEFRLLTEVKADVSEENLCIEGRCWKLSNVLDLDATAIVPRFACVSYVWGLDREPHAFDPNLNMSTRTRPALAAAIHVSDCDAFWTDIFCIPRDDPARQSTLENMGYIYSRAAEVIVVLGEDTYPVIEAMNRNGTISEADFHTLEGDAWISSVWTYQEIVNGGTVRFVSARNNENTISIECEEFFSTLGASLMQLERAKGMDTFATVKVFPNVSALEEILADWKTAGYTFRSALRIFSSMSRKRNQNTANYYYAILGAITDTSQELVWDPEQNLAEKVMSICEQKGDYSFIYTMAAREPDAKLCWRPQAKFESEDATSIPAVLQPILAWHCWGDAQPGHYDEDGFWLDEMIAMKQSAQIQNDGILAMSRFLHTDVSILSNDAIASSVLSVITSMGFQGSEMPIIVEDGLCFAIEPFEQSDIARILISGQIRWPMGAPGLIHLERNEGKRYVPCVFVGEIFEPHGSRGRVLL